MNMTLDEILDVKEWMNIKNTVMEFHQKEAEKEAQQKSPRGTNSQRTR